VIKIKGMINLAVLGSTGSIGRQTLEVVRSFPERLRVVSLCAGKPSKSLLEQVLEFRPEVVTTAETPTKEWLESLPAETSYVPGEEGIVACIEPADRVMNAISGVHGIKPAYLTLREGKTLLASNKESIICLGEVMDLSDKSIIPVDSEHNALFQLLEKVSGDEVKFIYLTASGGPFRNSSIEEMKRAKPSDALNHPRWNMGSKITVDSATLMNKGFEMLEARNLFGIELDRIKVVIHPQSTVHGIVVLRDGSLLMHASLTDMRIPIQHALLYPARLESCVGVPVITELSPLTFEEVDTEKFRSLYLARWAGEMGGAYVPALVGADEEAVSLFLQERIGFLEITELVEEVLSSVKVADPETIDEILEIIRWARKRVRELARRAHSSGGTS
jgi:1-deoxy-D-xylulose-5-phosphate reductoisomerase